jgi:hypothetical protein
MSNFNSTQNTSLPLSSSNQLHTDDLKNISLFIPRVFNNIGEDKIIDIFEKKMAYGKINHIDFVNVDTKNYKRVYIHFDYWFPTKNSIDIQEKLLVNNEESVKVYYDKLWYWLVVINKTVSQKSNILITYEDLCNMKEIQSIIDSENIQPDDNMSYDKLFCKYDECDDLLYEVEEYEDYEEYEEYNCDIENDYKKMDDLIDNYFVNDNEIEYVNRDYVDLIENKNMILINDYNILYNNYNILYHNYIHSLNLNLFLQNTINFNQNFILENQHQEDATLYGVKEEQEDATLYGVKEE